MVLKFLVKASYLLCIHILSNAIVLKNIIIKIDTVVSPLQGFVAIAIKNNSCSVEYISRNIISNNVLWK